MWVRVSPMEMLFARAADDPGRILVMVCWAELLMLADPCEFPTSFFRCRFEAYRRARMANHSSVDFPCCSQIQKSTYSKACCLYRDARVCAISLIDSERTFILQLLSRTDIFSASFQF